MFFFIVGVHPRLRPVEGGGRRVAPCPSCGGDRVFEEIRIRPYLTLFFVPLFPVGAGSPAWRCVSCGTLRDAVGSSVRSAGGPTWGTASEAPAGPEVGQPAGDPAGRGSHFCAFCGARLGSRPPATPSRVQCPECGKEYEIRS